MLTTILLGALVGPSSAEPFMRMPDVHGDKVAFTCEGDIWVGDLKSGKAVRLTRDAGEEGYARFSPDGTQIAFSGQYDGITEVYIIATAGGPPRRLTYRYDYAEPMAWTPDGKKVVVRRRNYPRSYAMDLIPAEGGAGEKIPLEFSAHSTFSKTPGKFAFTRYNRWDDAWFHYKGGLRNQIWSGDLPSLTFKQVTNVPGTNEYPTYGGDKVFFVNENTAKFTVMSVEASSGKVARVAGPYDFEVRQLGSDGKSLVYERGRFLERVDLASGAITPVSFELTSDLMHTRPYKAVADQNVLWSSLSGTGKRVYQEARGQIISLPAGEGEARVVMAKAGVRFRAPIPSPDAKSLAYFSDETGEQQLYVSGLDGSNPKQITKDAERRLVNHAWSPDSKWIGLNDSEMRFRLINVETGEDRLITKADQDWNGTRFDFSPDSKWIVYSQSDGYIGRNHLVMYEISTGTKTVLGNKMTSDFAPTFSKDGKYLAFLTTRNFGMAWDSLLNQLNTGNVEIPCLLLLSKDGENPLAPKEQDEAPADEKKPDAPAKSEGTKIDLDGLYERRIEVPVAPSSYFGVYVLGDRVILDGSGNVTLYDLAKKSGGTVTSGSISDVSADGKKLLVNRTRVVDASGTDVPATAGAVQYANLRLTIDPVAEWRNMFWDAWRHIRDYFYVKNMHGLDWPAIGRKYAALLPSVRSRDELDVLIRWMQAECGISHSYLQAGDQQDIKPKTSGAFLGIEVASDPSGFLKITKILRGDGIRAHERSPLLAAGVNVSEGHFLIEVAGVPIKAGVDYLAGLSGRAGQIVSIKLNDKPTAEGARVIRVRPVPSENRMRYLTWVEENRQYVAKATDGRIGYLHLAAMGPGDMADFVKQYFPQRNREAMIIDTRFNNGGSVQSAINRILAETVQGFFNMRASENSWTRQGEFFEGPMVALQNEFNISCGEEFTWGFRHHKRGPIIGRQSYGGEVGSSPGWPLADGGIVSVPNYGMWTEKDGWVIEGPGVKPDIEVLNDPNAYARGKDLQLEKGIEHLLAELKRNPVRRPKPPADPIRVKG